MAADPFDQDIDDMVDSQDAGACQLHMLGNGQPCSPNALSQQPECQTVREAAQVANTPGRMHLYDNAQAIAWTGLAMMRHTCKLLL